jgi:hypothetical protein
MWDMTSKTQMEMDSLVEEFVASFARLDGMETNKFENPVSLELAVEEANEFGERHWSPARVTTDPSLLEPVYAKLPAKFPKLFERLVLSYRWAEVELGPFRLIANPPGPDLSGLFRGMSKDSGLWESLIRAGYIQFGKGPDINYVPVCFDSKK